MAKIPVSFNTKDYQSTVNDELSMVSLQEEMRNRLGMAIEIDFNDTGCGVHRFSTKNDGKNDGFYFARKYPSGLKVVTFGTWRDRSCDFTWKSKKDEDITEDEKFLISEFSKEQKEKEALEKKYASFEAEQYVLNSPRGNAGKTAYAKKKHIDNALCITKFPINEKDDAIIVPVYKFDAGKNIYISAYQELFPQKKKNQKRGDFSGGWLLLGNGLPSANDIVYLCEGFATGISIYESTGKFTMVVFSCSQYKNVINAWKRCRGLSENFIIIADNDEPKDGEDMGAGEKAAKATGITYKLCPSKKPGSTDANDFVNDGYNLSHWIQTGEIKTLEAKVQSWIHDGNVIFEDLEPIRWLIKNWLPADGVSTIYGPSNSGKSFFALDIMLHLATSVGEDCYHGIKMHHAPVLYLCGEGYRGARIRMRAWCQNYGVENGELSRFYMADSPKDIDRLVDRDFIIDNIKNLDPKPKMIFIDTLNRFYSGNENDAQEMRNFLNSLSEISRTFDCGICLIHHSGVNIEAQNRARGSSALKAAIDTEIKIAQVKIGDDAYLVAEQTKQRDGKYQPALVYKFVGTPIDGLFDEDTKEQETGAFIEPVYDEKTRDEVLDKLNSEPKIKTRGGKEDRGNTDKNLSKWLDSFIDEIEKQYESTLEKTEDDKMKEVLKKVFDILLPTVKTKNQKLKTKEDDSNKSIQIATNAIDILYEEFLKVFTSPPTYYGRYDDNGDPYIRSDYFKKWILDYSTRMPYRSEKTEEQREKWAKNQMASPTGILKKLEVDELIKIEAFSKEEAEKLGITQKENDSSRPRKIKVINEDFKGVIGAADQGRPMDKYRG